MLRHLPYKKHDIDSLLLDFKISALDFGKISSPNNSYYKLKITACGNGWKVLWKTVCSDQFGQMVGCSYTK